jgi:folate-binding protein YgfZ
MTPGYRALRENVAWLDLTGRGKIAARGADRVRLLHALTTNHIEQLQPGSGCYAFFLDAQGHILADVYLFVFDEYLFIDTEPETATSLFQHIDRHIIADDVTLEDMTAAMATVGVEGPKAAGLLASLGAPAPAEAYAHAAWGAATVARASVLGGEGFLVFLPAAEKAGLIERLASGGAAAATGDDARAVRLENGRPRYGEDFGPAHLPQETQLLHALHFNKGCYLGQEIVERIRSRGHVNRLLVRVALESQPDPAAGLMSAAFSPALGKIIAYAYLRPEQARPGTRVEFGGIEGEVLPNGPLAR